MSETAKQPNEPSYCSNCGCVWLVSKNFCSNCGYQAVQALEMVTALDGTMDFQDLDVGFTHEPDFLILAGMCPQVWAE